MAKTYHWGALAAAAGTLVAVGLVVLIMLVVVEAGPAEATFPGKPGKIAYEGKDGANGDYEIYTINPGGEVSSKLPTTIRKTIRLPGGAVSRERLLPPPVGLIPRRSAAAALNRNVSKSPEPRSVLRLQALSVCFLLRCCVLFTKMRDFRISPLFTEVRGSRILRTSP